MKTKRDTAYFTRAALIGAMYAAFTLLGQVFGLSYGAIQFRFAEAMCILPLFTNAAVEGLSIGCLTANLLSTVSPFDALFGTLATFLAAVATRKFRHITVKGFPLISFFSPVVCNALIVGAQIAFFTARDAFLPAFALNVLSVGGGEAGVIFVLGTALFLLMKKNEALKKAVCGKDTSFT